MRTNPLSFLVRWDVLAALAFVAVLAAVPIYFATQHRPSAPPTLLGSGAFPAATAGQPPAAPSASPAAPAAQPAPTSAPAPAPAAAPAPSRFIRPDQAVDPALLVAVPRPAYLPRADHRTSPAGLNGKTGPLVLRAVADLPEMTELGAGEFRRLPEAPLAAQTAPKVDQMGVVVPSERPAAERPGLREDPTKGKWQQAVTPAILAPRRAADLRYAQLRARGIVDPPEMEIHPGAAPAQAPLQPVTALASALSPDPAPLVGPGIQAPDADPARVQTDPTGDQSRLSAVSAPLPRRQAAAPPVRLSIPDPFENANSLLLRTVFSDDDPTTTNPILPPRPAMEPLPVPPAPPPPPPTPPPAPPAPPATQPAK